MKTKAKLARSVLTDTSFWLAYYDPGDCHHAEAIDAMAYIEVADVLVPWPILYETLNTRFVKRKTWAADFKARLAGLSVAYVDDTQFRERALRDTLDLSEAAKRHLSLADAVVRYMLEEPTRPIGFLATYDDKHFSDVCARKSIEIFHGGDGRE